MLEMTKEDQLQQIAILHINKEKYGLILNVCFLGRAE